jgi:hypothetical protein
MKQDDAPRRRQLSADDVTRQRKAEATGSTLFRRNRTLVGSLSSSVSSANELGGDLRSPRAHVHHLTAHRRRLGTVFTIVAVAACFLLWFIYEFTAGIQVAATDSGVAVQSERYQRAIADYYAAHPLERLRFALNEAQLNNYLQQVTPEVAAVHAAGSAGFATSQFDMTFRKPVASWLINASQYYVDENGVSFQVNYFDNPQVKIIDQSGVPQANGEAVASGRFLRFVGRTVALARGDNLSIEQAIIPPQTTRQVEVKVTGHNYPVKLSLDRPVGEQVEDMQRAIAYFDAKHQTPQYIDVRVSGKAYYK